MYMYCMYMDPIMDVNKAHARRYYLLSTHIEFSQIFKTLQIQIEIGALK